MTAALDQSLGQLGRLPGEVRNRIYELSVNYIDEEMEINSSCRHYRSLFLVSKTVHQESISFIQAGDKQTCPHYHFRSKLLLEFESKGTGSSIFAQARRSIHPSSQHDYLKNGVTYRLVTSHMGNDVPLAVVVKLELPSGSDVNVYGASETRSKCVELEGKRTLEALERLAPGMPEHPLHATIGQIEMNVVHRTIERTVLCEHTEKDCFVRT